MESKWIEIILAAAEWVLFCHVVCGEKPALLTVKRAVYMVVAGILTVCDICFFDAAGAVWLMLLFFTFVVFEVTFWEGVRVWFVVCLILGICHQCLQFVLRNFLWRSQWKWGVMISEITVSVLCILFYILFPKRKRLRIGQLPFHFWILIAGVMFAFYAMAVYLGMTSVYIRGRRGSVVWAAAIIFGVIGIFVILVMCIYYYKMAAVFRVQNEYTEKFNAQQKEYFDRLIEKEQDTRNFRHEISNHLISINGMADRKEYEALTAYVNELLQEMREIGMRQYDVGNHMINTLVNYYFYPIREVCDITVSGYVDEINAISGPDLCILVSNLVKNAIEAVERVSFQEKKIRFEVEQGKQYFHIYVENTMVQEKNEMFGIRKATSKSDKRNHGIGLFNVRRVVEKYGGTFECRQRNGVCIAEIYIKLIE